MIRCTNLLAAVLCGVCLFVWGCMGGAAPKERYLRLESSYASGMMQPGGSGGVLKKIVAIKDFESLPALQRTAVLYARGNVLEPSTTLYWEGTPAELCTAFVVESVSAASGLHAAWPYKSRTQHDAVLSGSVTAFEVVEGGGESVRIRIRVDLWSQVAKTHIAGRTFEAIEPVTTGSPDAIAMAAAKALSTATQEAAAWASANLNES